MKKHKLGITLVEIMVVILILGLLTLIATPLLSQFGLNQRLKSVAKNIGAQLRLTRTLAMTKNIEHAILIYTRSASETYMRNNIVIVNNTDEIVEKPWNSPSLIEIADVSGSGGMTRITISANGTTGTPRSIHLIQKGAKINGSPYNETANYTSLSQKERVKCHTITITGSGRTRIYPYGINTPWSSNEL
ncbi:Tfp pilus assembly protein FimT/FimU [Chlamydiota bacterium]